MSKIIKNVLVGEYGATISRYGKSFVNWSEDSLNHFRKSLPKPVFLNSDMEKYLFEEQKCVPSDKIMGYVTDINLVKTSVNTVLLYIDFEPTENSNHLLNQGTKFSICANSQVTGKAPNTFVVGTLLEVTIDDTRKNDDGKSIKWDNYHQFNKLFR